MEPALAVTGAAGLAVPHAEDLNLCIAAPNQLLSGHVLGGGGSGRVVDYQDPVQLSNRADVGQYVDRLEQVVNRDLAGSGRSRGIHNDQELITRSWRSVGSQDIDRLEQVIDSDLLVQWRAGRIVHHMEDVACRQ